MAIMLNELIWQDVNGRKLYENIKVTDNLGRISYR